MKAFENQSVRAKYSYFHSSLGIRYFEYETHEYTIGLRFVTMQNLSRIKLLVG